MRKGELVPRGVLLATALAGVALAGCQRPPEATPLPQRTPLAASGQPKPSAIEAEIQARVQATVTAQQPAGVKLPEAQNLPSEPESIRLQSKQKPYFELSVPSSWKITSNTDLNRPGLASPNQTELQINRTTLTSPEEIKTFTQRNRNWFVDLMNKQGYESRDESLKFVMSSPHPPSLRSGFTVAVGRIQQRSAQRDLRAVMFITDSYGWVFALLSDPSKTSQDEQEFIRTMEGLNIAGMAVQQAARPAEAPKPAAGEKVAIRLKPEELFRALLTTPFQLNELPPGFSVKGKTAGTLDTTAQALKAIGQVNALVAENDPRFGGMPNGGISYTVFPDTANAKAAYDMFAKRPDSRTISNSPYPTAFFVEQSPFAKVNVCVALVGNTFIAATLTSMDQAPREGQTIQLAQAGIKHLQRVGR